MARLWLCAGGAGCLLVFLVLHSRLSGSPVLREFVFPISWRTEDVLYRLDVGWPKHSEYFTGATFCVAVDSLNGLVYVAQRGDDIQKVLVFTEDGYFLRAWNHTVDTPHGMFAASTPQEPAVWITDVGSGSFGHTVKKYNSFGDLVQVLGTPGQRGAGLNPLQFDNPAELYVEDTGDIYVVDGDGGLNNRLVKLSQDFMILWLHGERGTGPAKFNVPHSVTVDSSGRRRCPQQTLALALRCGLLTEETRESRPLRRTPGPGWEPGTTASRKRGLPPSGSPPTGSSLWWPS
ncbi:NHL repeat-containing protein 3 isoform X2 [Desmodus rotundus]|uniref:NHL repeat-containing protein 3 isoform X2 n=1 Tax=Desmodus rotundus TaxID=9430 RepID=UPI002381329D|nr:NHL repeat-containing protein 3 isoform X2 [Desmodus rotundus]